MFKPSFKLATFLILCISVVTLLGVNGVNTVWEKDDLYTYKLPSDTNDPDSTLPYPFDDGETGSLYGENPDNYKENVEFDPETGNYIIHHSIGGLQTKPPTVMTPEQYRAYVSAKQVQDYWKSKTQSEEAAKAEGRDPENSLIPSININQEWFERVFGGSSIDIRPQGFAELTFGGRIQRVDNPLIPVANRSNFTFDFDQRIQMNVTGNVGEKLQILTNYDTEATFSFENQIKLEWEGDEDDIIKKLEVGNVSLPVNSTLISGAQSLFGVKGQFQFGKLTLNGVFSEQRSETQSINIQGGATTTEFEIWGDEYEANRHYFLSHYFRDNYEQNLENAPLITSPVQITKVEVWVTNTRQNSQDIRNIVAFMDLGETQGRAHRDGSLPGPDIFEGVTNSGSFPSNSNNNLDPDQLEVDYPLIRDVSEVNQLLNSAGFEEAIEYVELANARKLAPSEFTFNSQLGYISLGTSLNQDEVLAVAFQYTAGGRTYQVGEFSTDGVVTPNALVVKMLKSTILDVKTPVWDLMMKNVYSLSAYGVQADGFRLNVLYRNDETGAPIPYLPESNIRDQLLVRVMELDKVNNNNDPIPDGFFDFIPGVTINAQNGRVYFPVLEPFGSNLANKLETDEMREQYVFSELYDSTLFVAQNETRLNKYLLQGEFSSSSSSEIQLNAFNIPQGSVSVTAGGTKLVEGVDYNVDYNLGRVKILNDGILNSGMPIRVDFENNALFNFQQKSFMGVTADYRLNENLNIGGSLVRLSERPLTQKVNIGDEPIANTIVGLSGSYTKDAPYLTNFVDRIPFIDTKEKSNILVQGEVARILPGSPRGIEIGGSATTYLDDFESSQTTIDISNPITWRMASTPQNQPDLFPEASENSLAYNFNRGRLAWYNIDPLFHNDQAITPDNIRNNKQLQSYNSTRQVLIEEVFPDLDIDQSQARNISTFDLAFYPNEKGPYNYDVEPTAYSDGLNEDGSLANPQSRWGGVMRDINSTNFEEQNIEFIQFWVLNPFVPNGNDPTPTQGGDIYINLGSVSEDILKDGKQAIENAVPADGDLTQLDSTIWGYAPSVRPAVVAFDNDNNARDIQDIGYDLLDDQYEGIWPDDSTYGNYLQRITDFHGNTSNAYLSAQDDPAADNFQYYLGDDLDNNAAGVLERYKGFNNPQGNSNPTTVNGATAFATNTPDIEDVNGDQTLSKTETYYQYKISFRPEDLGRVGQNYITDVDTVITDVQPDGQERTASWVQFKIPIYEPDRTVGSISDFRSIRFIRMFMQNFPEPVVVRFATMQFVRGEWRRYQFALDGTRENLSHDDQNNTVFEVNAVNIEQNSSRLPVPYVLPPGISREVLYGTTSANQQNEQSLSLRILNLEDGDARAVFRNLDFDMRLYGRMQMFTHAEAADPFEALRDDDLTVFIRLGADYDENYYEFEKPLKVTPVDGSVSDRDADLIWPSENEFDFKLESLTDAKQERDRLYSQSGTANSVPYSVEKEDGNVTVVGRPNLGNVRTMMIGVRNPKRRLATDMDDGLPKSAEIWVNELRLTDFDQNGGWAANARVAAKLADFANVSVSGRTSSVGFGSLDQSVSEFQQEAVWAYDLQTSFELGKFFNKDAGLRIPLFYGTSEEWITPRFNPLDPDIELNEAINNLASDGERDSLRDASQAYTRRKSINLTNVRKERTGKKSQKKPQIYDIENLSATYSFSEVFRRDINTVYERTVQHRGNLNYTYRTQPKPVEPFKNISWLKSNYLTFIRDFNFYFYPRSFSAIMSLDRSYTSMQMRNTDAILGNLPPQFATEIDPTYDKSFTLDREYTMLFDLSKGLRFDYRARMDTRIDEVIGAPDTERNKDTIIENLLNFGRPTNYHQTINLNWQVPIDQFPFLDFATVTASYTGDYDWQAQTLTNSNGTNGLPDPDDPLYFGNTIQNNYQLQLTGNFNLTALYNKVPYLKKAQRGGKQRQVNERAREMLRGPRQNQRQAKDDKGDDDEEPSTFDKILMETAKVAMMVKSVSGGYSRSEGQILPGFSLSPELVGLGASNSNYAPGVLFTFGSPDDIRPLAVENDWLIRNPNLNNQYSQTFTETMNYRVTVEPVNSFRIIISAQNNTTSSLDEFFRFNDSIVSNDGVVTEGFESQNTFSSQNYSTSYYMMSTAFGSLNADNDYDSDVYLEFLANRLEISRRLAEQAEATASAEGIDLEGYSADLLGTTDSANYGYRYYSVSSQQVLIPAFLAAYSGQNVDNIDLNPVRSTPLPNWNITYDGLSKIPFFKKIFNSFTINHAYRSNYTISNISTNLLRDIELEDSDIPLNNNGDIMAQDQINAVTLSEQFSPLIGFNSKLKNNTTIKIEYKRDRNVSLGLTNSQITETHGSEWIVGTGYIIKDLKLKFLKVGPRRVSPVSNLELRGDLGIRDNVTVIRQIIQGVNQATAGQRVTTVKLSADYQVSDRVQTKLFYDLNMSRFKTATAYPITTHQFGLSVRLNLGK